MAEVWDENWFGSTKTLDVTMAGLRRRLTEAAEAGGRPARLPEITTLRGARVPAGQAGRSIRVRRGPRLASRSTTLAGSVPRWLPVADRSKNRQTEEVDPPSASRRHLEAIHSTERRASRPSTSRPGAMGSQPVSRR